MSQTIVYSAIAVLSFCLGALLGWLSRSLIGRLALVVLLIALVAVGAYVYGAMNTLQASRSFSWLSRIW